MKRDKHAIPSCLRKTDEKQEGRKGFSQGACDNRQRIANAWNPARKQRPLAIVAISLLCASTMLGAEVYEGKDIDPGDLLGIALVTLGDGMGNRGGRERQEAGDRR